MCWCICFFFFKQKTAYEMRISDWSSDVCSSDLLNTKIPGGNIGTGTEATAVKVSDTGLPYDFLVLGSRAPDLNGGSKFYIPNPDFLLSESGLDAARAYFGLPAGQPDFDPGREFDSTENTPAAYAQGTGRASCRERVGRYV